MKNTMRRSRTRSKLFRGLGDTSRLMVLETLLEGPRCVTEVIAATGLSQPSVSGHLACLRDCGLVERDARGRFAYYSLAGPHVRHIIACADAILGVAGGRLEECPRYNEAESVESDAERVPDAAGKAISRDG